MDFIKQSKINGQVISSSSSSMTRELEEKHFTVNIMYEFQSNSTLKETSSTCSKTLVTIMFLLCVQRQRE